MTHFLPKWPFWQVGVTNKVNFFTNRHGDFMTSSMKTSPKNPLRLVSGDVLLVSSCQNMQKHKISEESYIELYTVKCYLGKPRSYLDELLIMRSVCENDFNGAIGSRITVF